MKCFNRNVLIGLAAIAAALFFIAPSARGALPLLAVAACPLSMIVMMGGMAKMGMNKSTSRAGAQTQPDEIAPKDAEIARLNSLLREDRASELN